MASGRAAEHGPARRKRRKRNADRAGGERGHKGVRPPHQEQEKHRSDGRDSPLVTPVERPGDHDIEDGKRPGGDVERDGLEHR